MTVHENALNYKANIMRDPSAPFYVCLNGLFVAQSNLFPLAVVNALRCEYCEAPVC